ncbi:MAG TPA: hypothetical protein DEO70_12235 [Bacteroidales bacterium]|nr:MAG: hypothetical protein A2X11_10230 [Bacteroidetes bacterium GWE2_42_24]OFY25888.1 MAG: hypothetical protein A2X09_09605 [Bacteroidetes bacterium GWF2_43_11]HBZ67597.1 hypothetical protein [Bacteroidales bacterium]
MNILDIPQAGVHLEYASCMDELIPSQFETYCRLFIELKEGKISIADFYVRMVIELLDIDLGYGYKRLPERVSESIHDNLRQITETLTWLLVERDENGVVQIEPNIEFARNLIPALGNNMGPADALQNVSLAEFRDAIGHSMNFTLTNDEEHLNRLCASLYRPKNPRWLTLSQYPEWNGDKRFLYSSAYAETSFNRFLRFPIWQRFGVYLMFNAALNFLKTGTVTIEGKEISFSILWEGNEPQSDKPGIGMAGVLFSLAETGVFGTLKDVERVNLYVALARLYQVKINEPKMNKDDTNHPNS